VLQRPLIVAVSSPTKSARSSRQFFSLATAVAAGSGRHEQRLDAERVSGAEQSRVTVSHSANANMPRNRLSTSVPQ